MIKVREREEIIDRIDMWMKKLKKVDSDRDIYKISGILRELTWAISPAIEKDKGPPIFIEKED